MHRKSHNNYSNSMRAEINGVAKINTDFYSEAYEMVRA